jgi:hypothetical protein
VIIIYGQRNVWQKPKSKKLNIKMAYYPSLTQAVACNIGLKLCQGEVVLFAGGCLEFPCKFIEGLSRQHMKGDKCIFGPVFETRGFFHKHGIERIKELDNQIDYMHEWAELKIRQASEINASWTYASLGNFSGCRKKLVECSGFDERITSADIAGKEFAYRLLGTLDLDLCPSLPLFRTEKRSSLEGYGDFYSQDAFYTFLKHRTVEMEVMAGVPRGELTEILCAVHAYQRACNREFRFDYPAIEIREIGSVTYIGRWAGKLLSGKVEDTDSSHISYAKSTFENRITDTGIGLMCRGSFGAVCIGPDWQFMPGSLRRAIASHLLRCGKRLILYGSISEADAFLSGFAKQTISIAPPLTEIKMGPYIYGSISCDFKKKLDCTPPMR